MNPLLAKVGDLENEIRNRYKAGKIKSYYIGGKTGNRAYWTDSSGQDHIINCVCTEEYARFLESHLDGYKKTI